MDYQFIHSVVSEVYVDLPAAKQAPAPYLEQLRKYTGVCDCLDNNIGEVFSYISLRSGNEVPVAFFSRTARKKKAVSVCKFIQSAAWEQRGSFLLDHMDTILAHPFYTEEQIDDFAERKIPVPAQEDDLAAGALRRVPVHKDAIRAILYGTMLRWQQGAAQIHIAVPKDEMGAYNDYVLAAVREIYSYFPAYMRGEIGFSSYLLPAHEKDYPKFSIIFIPYSMADARTVMLDGSTPNVYDALIKSTGLRSLDRVLDYIAQLDEPSARQNFLRDIYEDIEKEAKTFSPMNYRTMGEGLSILEMQGSVAEQLPAWLQFAQKKQSYPASLRNRIDNKISQTMRPQDLLSIAEDEFRREPKIENLVGIINRCQPLCLGRPEWGAALWNFLDETLEQNTFSPEEVFKAFEDNLTVWSSLSDGNECVAKKEFWGNSTAEQYKEQTEARLRAIAAEAKNVESLKDKCAEELADFEKKAGPYADSARIAEHKEALETLKRKLTAEQAEKELEAEKNKAPQTQAEIKTEIKEIDRLIKCLPADRMAEENSLYEALLARRGELEQQYQSSQTMFVELTREIDAAKDYFDALEKAAKKEESLSESDRETIRGKLDRKRPQLRRQYFDAFRQHYGVPLTQEALTKETLFFGRRVTEDLIQIYNSPQPVQLEGKNTAALLRELNVIKTEANWLGVKQNLRVALEGYETEAALVEQVAGLDKDSRYSKDSFSEISIRLLRAGVYTPDQLKPLLEIAEWVDADIEPLLAAVICGKVKGMDKPAYEVFLTDVCDVLIRTRTVRNESEALGWIQPSFDGDDCPDPLAEEALNSLIKANEGAKNKKKRGLVIGGISLGVVALAVLGIIIGVFARKPAEDPFAEIIKTAYQNSIAAENGRFALENTNLTDQNMELVLSYYDPLNLSDYSDLLNMAMEDPTLLEQLGYLTELDLRGNDITDLTPLSELKGLRQLYLDGNNGVQDFTALDKLENLMFLSLKDTSVSASQVSEICQSHPNCFVLWTNDEQEEILSVGTAKYIKGSKEWDLRNMGLSDIPVNDEIQGMLTDLKALYLSDNPICSLQWLTYLEGLECLDLTATQLDDQLLQQIGEMENLLVLNISDNPGISQNAVDELKNKLSGNCEVVYTALAAVEIPEQVEIKGKFYDKAAEELDLSGQGLSGQDIENLDQFTNLKRLDLSDNMISDLSSIGRLNNLEWLKISNNQVTDLSGLSGLDKLMVLYADNNPFEAIGYLERMSSLKVLSLAGIKTLTDLSGLERLNTLEVLDLTETGVNFSGESSFDLGQLENLKILKLSSSEELSQEMSDALKEKMCYIIPFSFAADDIGN